MQHLSIIISVPLNKKQLQISLHYKRYYFEYQGHSLNNSLNITQFLGQIKVEGVAYLHNVFRRSSTAMTNPCPFFASHSTSCVLHIQFIFMTYFQDLRCE